MLKISSNEVSRGKEKRRMKKEVIGVQDRLVDGGEEEGRRGEIVLHILTYYLFGLQYKGPSSFASLLRFV